MSEDLSISDDVIEQMCAAAFRSLCDHLQQRSDEVQNIDLMSISGFCRNCLAKWMVLEARKLSKQLIEDKSFATTFIGSNDKVCKQQTIHDLNSFGYEEAAKEVYGSTISEWKKRHQKKATDDQMRLYKESINVHATHDSELLKKVDDDNINTTTTNNLSEKVMIRLQAGAFNSLCHHLRVRSDTVQNLELMTISGFCRNCLAKWLVVEARSISDKISADTVAASYFPEKQKSIIDSLDLFGYEEAAKYVYGVTYPEWKKHHQKKSTDEQMKRYNKSKSIHAKHDKELLATRSSSTLKEPTTTNTEHISKPQICVNKPQDSLLSDVCCQDVDAIDTSSADNTQTVASIARPPKGSTDLKIGILTVSDRASKNMYETGDLSGPAVETTVTAQMNHMNSSFSDQHISISHVAKYIVPDDHNAIKDVLLSWSSSEQSTNANIPRGQCDLIFTTGGTGFSNRDVTPEATLDILDRECQGLMSWATMVLTAKQPLATLSRAAAGTIGNTLIVNLPGNPLGAAQVVEILFPLLLHAIKDIQTGKMDVLV